MHGRSPAVFHTRASISCRALDDGLVLLDESNGRSFLLDRVASMIFCFCDGIRDTEAILNLLKAAFESESAEQLGRDLEKTLSFLQQENIIGIAGSE